MPSSSPGTFASPGTPEPGRQSRASRQRGTRPQPGFPVRTGGRAGAIEAGTARTSITARSIWKVRPQPSLDACTSGR
jgi:hypothetical protein